ncbi:MAG: GAF domain-containing protein [Firmicutes bacterium]|nr:GAF domain-containing protein [Bacillota bacterium]
MDIVLKSEGDYPEDKPELYLRLQDELRVLVEAVSHPIPNLANASALLWQAMKDINWVGFYLVHEGRLVLGPFQGKPACVYIPVGKGVCGTAVKENRTVRVDNVHEFSGHIACDAASNSEIVIPMRDGDRIVGVLDIDSPVFSRFDDEDQVGLEAIVRILERACAWR